MAATHAGSLQRHTDVMMGEQDDAPSFFVRALYDFDSDDSSSLSFRKGALIEVLTQLDSGWWDGLLDNDVRGWFPSNYVEPIPDEEAELELAARARLQDPLNSTANLKVGLDPSNFSGLGFGSGFDSLQALIKGDGGLGGSDAFGQLAEAAMLDPRRRIFGIGDAADPIDRGLPTVPGKRSSRISESSYATTSASPRLHNTSQSDLSSIPPRSHSSSITEADAVKNAARSGSPYTSVASEKERLRTQSLSNAHPNGRASTSSPSTLGANLGRPRAATGSQATSPDSRSNVREPRNGRASRHSQMGLWIPKTTDRGDIIYYNTKTGATSHELPEGYGSPGDDLSGRSSSELQDARGRAGADKRASAANSSRPSTANSNGTAVLLGASSSSGAPASNAVENMPDPRTVPRAWKLRVTDDDRSFFFVNRRTRECLWELPAGVASGSSSATRGAAAVGLDDESVDPAMTLDSDESDIDGAMTSRLPGKAPRARGLTLKLASSNGTSSRRRDRSEALAAADHPVLGSVPPAPQSLLDDEAACIEVQKQLAPSQPTHVVSLLRAAAEAIRQLAAVASEQIGTDGLSDADRAVFVNWGGKLGLPRIEACTAAVVSAVREILYVSGSLSLAASDTSALSELVALLTEHSLADTNGADAPATQRFNKAILAMQHRSDPASERLLRSAGISAADQVSNTPGTMQPIGRRVNATISKLVLSARQVIDHSTTLSSSPTAKRESTMTDLDAEVFERLYQCRQRLREDAIELSRVLQALGYEAERNRHNAILSQNSRGWLRRMGGSLESDYGLSGIGPAALGGGMAAGWSGSGFALPTKHEVAVIKIESQGGYSNPFELKKDIQHALTRGKSILLRKPNTTLTIKLVESLEPHQEELKQHTQELAASLTGEAQYEAVASNVESVLARYGTLITLIEDIDLASSLDVDGPGSKEMVPGSAIHERNHANATKAKEGVKTMAVLKQASYDVASNLLLHIQDLSVSGSGSDAAEQGDRVERVTNAANILSRITAVLVSTLKSLAQIAEEQLKDASPYLGARALVYGADEVSSTQSPTSSVFSRRSIATSSGLHEELDALARVAGSGTSGAGEEGSSDAEVMYLGPGLAVPNGPRSSGSKAAAAASSSSIVSPTVPNSAHSSLVPTSRGGLGSMISRQRSTSVTTGGSNRSMQSLQESTKQLLSRRGTLAESHASETLTEETDDSRTTGKIRRLLGDDAPLSAQESNESKRREEETPWYLEADYSLEDIVMGADGSVKGATLGALLARLTMHDSFDASFNNTFLMTYRSFTTTEDLLDLLFMRYRVTPPEGMTDEESATWAEKKQKPIRLRVFNVLKSWLETHFYEGEDDMYLDKIKKFALDEMAEASAMKAPSMQLMRLVDRRQGDGEQMIRKMVLPTSAPAPILPKNMKKLKFLEIDPMEMARQLTLIESRLYNQVKPAECLGLKWTKPDNDVHAKGIMDSINTHNRISAWVAEAILQQDDLKKRAALIKHFIAIADRCRALNNFSGMWAIVSALSTAPIHRLRRTWDAVSQKHVVVFESLETLMSASRNWANYRETIHKLNPPCVPFLGRYLGDLTFIEDGNRDRLKGDERLINFGKRQKTAEVIREIMIHQSTPYNLSPVAAIQKFIEDNLVESRGADDLYEQSLLLEPREREDEKIARLLQESGFL